jgi:hypothetical protein
MYEEESIERESENNDFFFSVIISSLSDYHVYIRMQSTIQNKLTDKQQEEICEGHTSLSLLCRYTGI